MVLNFPFTHWLCHPSLSISTSFKMCHRQQFRYEITSEFEKTTTTNVFYTENEKSLDVYVERYVLCTVDSSVNGEFQSYRRIQI